MKKTVLPEEIVEKIVKDMRDRRGFRQLLDSIDEDVRKEIIEAWERIVRETLRENLE